MSKKGGGGEAAQARADEQERQQRIREGTSRINSIFDGATVVDNKLSASAAFDPNGRYFLEDGTAWAPTPQQAPQSLSSIFTTDANGNTLSGPNAAPDQPAQAPSDGGAAEFAKLASEGKLYGGTKQTQGFNDEFFQGRRQAYLDYATPQLEDQYGKAQKELTFALDRSGLLDSSVRGQKAGDLQKLYDTQKQQVADQALTQENEARTAVEDARSNLVATLNATGDAQGAANSAIARAGALSKPGTFNPLSNLFADFTSGLGTQAALERADYYGGSGAGGAKIGRYNTGLFTPGGSVATRT